MKKLILLFVFLAFIGVSAKSSPVVIVKQDTAAAQIDDVVFTEVGSAEDSAANARVEKTIQKDSVTTSGINTGDTETEGSKTLWVVFLLGFGGGFLAFLMPCIYPMVPLTVSFFTKRAETKGKGIQGALLYGLSIIVIYVAVGVLITLIFGATALNTLSTDAFFNIFIFLVLIIFGVSFLGAFEITLPSRFVNKLDAKSDSKGLTGIFFMAATLTVVSFSCTGPIIGSVLVSIEQDIWTPIVAMFGFSLALALIFSVFAVFPSWLTSLPKSGGWLNSVKVVLGLMEIALALKFFSVADLSYHWGILDREVFLSIWIVIAFVIGFYLLGKIKFSHDSDVPYVSVPRIFMAGAAFAFAIYMIPGLWGAPLKAISGLAPPMYTQDFVGGQAGPVVPDSTANKSKTKKYANIAELPHGIDGFFDYEEALAYAKEVNKPLFLDFTGHGCVNCREMEANVWVDPRVLKHLKEDYVVVSLYVDDRTALPESEQFESKEIKKKVNTIGKKFQHLQYARFKTQSQPYYVLLGTDEKELVSPPIGAEFDIEKYLKYLESGLEAFAAQNK